MNVRIQSGVANYLSPERIFAWPRSGLATYDTHIPSIIIIIVIFYILRGDFRGKDEGIGNTQFIKTCESIFFLQSRKPRCQT